MVQFGCRVCGVSAVVSLLLAGLAAASSDLFDNQLGDINYCKKQCQITVKNKSPAKDSILNACHRGCRLYSICQFVNGNAGFNTSREECQGACQEAYSKLLEQEACSTGCASQPSEPEIKRRKVSQVLHTNRDLKNIYLNYITISFYQLNVDTNNIRFYIKMFLKH
uniref:Transmembrane protein 59-like n=1 Tax=Oncorhynchus kisutch TaxID=8019 RepID=A0A8C7MG43_ONCKI